VPTKDWRLNPLAWAVLSSQSKCDAHDMIESGTNGTYQVPEKKAGMVARFLAGGGLVMVVTFAGFMVWILATNIHSSSSAHNYVASKLRTPFHRPDCKWAAKISDENAVWYVTREDAIKDGHKPCKVCKP
jgi:hypothetical protein